MSKKNNHHHNNNNNQNPWSNPYQPNDPWAQNTPTNPEDYAKYFGNGAQNNSFDPSNQIDNAQLLQQQQMQYQQHYQQQQQQQQQSSSHRHSMPAQGGYFGQQPPQYQSRNAKQNTNYYQQGEMMPNYYNNNQVYDPNMQMNYQQNYYFDPQTQMWQPNPYGQDYQAYYQQGFYGQQPQQQQQFDMQQQIHMQNSKQNTEKQLHLTKKDKNIDKTTTKQLQEALQGMGFELEINDESDDDNIKNESDEEENQNQTYKEKNQSVLFRTQQGIFYQKFDAPFPEPEKSLDSKNIFSFYTKQGSQIIIADNNQIALYSIRKKKILRKATRKNIQLMHLSQNEKFLVTVQMIDKNNYSCYLLDPSTLKEVKEIKLENYARFRWPLVQFDEKDSFIFIKQTNHIQIQDTDSFLPVTRISMPQYENQLYLSPKKENLQFMICQPETADEEGRPIKGQIKLYDFSKSLEKPECEIEMDHAQEIKPIWSPDGQKLLIWIQTMHDKTNQSYYGQHKLYIYSKEDKTLKEQEQKSEKTEEKQEEENQGKQDEVKEEPQQEKKQEEEQKTGNMNLLRQIYLYKGPIHDIQWNFDSTHFVVSSGYMPAGTVLFNKEGYPEFEFGRHHKNFVRWAKKRFLLIAGFGNLNGDVEIWDTIKFEKVGTCRAHTAVSCVWSPCGRKFMIGVLNPRLRQGNKMKVFKYDGTVLNNVDYSNSELYEVLWRPENFEYKDRSPSPKKEETSDDKPKKLLFQARGGGAFQAQLRAAKEEKQAEPRKLQPDEKFNSQEPDSPKGNPDKQHRKDSGSPGTNNEQKKKRKESKEMMITRADPNKPKPPIIPVEEDDDENGKKKKNKKKGEKNDNPKNRKTSANLDYQSNRKHSNNNLDRQDQQQQQNKNKVHSSNNLDHNQGEYKQSNFRKCSNNNLDERPQQQSNYRKKSNDEKHNNQPYSQFRKKSDNNMDNSPQDQKPSKSNNNNKEKGGKPNNNGGRNRRDHSPRQGNGGNGNSNKGQKGGLREKKQRKNSNQE